MNIAFFSNYLNHHQLPFCLAMDRLTNGQFTFVATMPTPMYRLKLGYHEMNKQYQFVLPTYENEKNVATARSLAKKCDVVIIGSAPEWYLEQRINQEKLTFRYSERLYKKGLLYAFEPKNLVAMIKHHYRYRNKPLYMLCASAYTAFDYSLTHCYANKAIKWGYYPEVKEYDINTIIKKKKDKGYLSILWCGRLISWKHPETALVIAQKLKRAGYHFVLNIVGNGDMEAAVCTYMNEHQIDDCVHFLGAMSPEEVRKQMELADIFLCTSDFNEGWGAVINESMNSGCAVIASHAIGSVPFLIQDSINGFIYKNADIKDLFQKTEILIKDQNLRISMGKKAYESLVRQWNANIAATRLLIVSQSLINGQGLQLYEEGPCSKAERLSNWWYK